MKKIIIISGIVFLGSVAGASAHGPMNWDEAHGGMGMMRYIEDAAIGSPETHEEMETLMEKMMSGKLTQEEADTMVDLMKTQAGPMAMMLARQSLGNSGMARMMGIGDGAGRGMMAGSGFGVPGIGVSLWMNNVWAWAYAFMLLVWLVAGVLIIVWLWQHIHKPFR